MNPGRFPRATAEVSAVCLFLVTILGSVSLDFAVEARVASHEFHFLGFGVLLSSASGSIDICGNSSIDIHMISSLRGGALSIIVVSSLVIVPPIVLLGGKFECLEESLTSLGELGCCLPFEMGFAGLFFPFFESPGDFSGGVEGRGVNNGASESLGHSMLESFDSSFVI